MQHLGDLTPEVFNSADLLGKSSQVVIGLRRLSQSFLDLTAPCAIGFGPELFRPLAEIIGRSTALDSHDHSTPTQYFWLNYSSASWFTGFKYGGVS